MNLRLLRRWYTERSTIGELSLDGAFECYTLEDRIGDGPKVPGHTAIPAGRYRLVLTFSQRFQRELPLLVDVPGFSGIRMHAGNTDADTAGCILVGQVRLQDEIHQSRAALVELLPKIARGIAEGPVWLSVEYGDVDPLLKSPGGDRIAATGDATRAA